MNIVSTILYSTSFGEFLFDVVEGKERERERDR